MATHKTKEELVRLAWIAALRREGHRKCQEAYSSKGGLVCALGLLREVAKADPYLECVESIGALAGLNDVQSCEIVELNDGDLPYTAPHTFAEIADVIEGWFK